MIPIPSTFAPSGRSDRLKHVIARDPDAENGQLEISRCGTDEITRIELDQDAAGNRSGMVSLNRSPVLLTSTVRLLLKLTPGTGHRRRAISNCPAMP